MVNILLVSHSYQLASGVAELVRQMAPSDSVKIDVAAGIGEDHQEIGTNAVEIMEKLNALYTPEGTLVLMDLGSAILSAEMALDKLDEAVKTRVRLCPAPFVEGALAAGVVAKVGWDLESVYREAMSALLAKQQQLQPEASQEDQPAPQQVAEATPKEEVIKIVLPVTNESGLHARPAALFAKTIGSHNAKVTVTNLTENKGPVTINGLIAVMLLAAKKGDVLKIQAEGEEKQEVIDALQKLFAENFGE
jgi:phosphocarrier protein FPr